MTTHTARPVAMHALEGEQPQPYLAWLVTAADGRTVGFAGVRLTGAMPRLSVLSIREERRHHGLGTATQLSILVRRRLSADGHSDSGSAAHPDRRRVQETSRR